MTDERIPSREEVPRDDEHRFWPMRWLYTRRTRKARLHRVIAGEYTEDLLPVGVKNGKSLCGLTGDFAMPGIFGWMGWIPF